MPRNFSELKSGGGGTIPMLSPHPEKSGGRVPPPVPHRSTPVWTTDIRHVTLWLIVRLDADTANLQAIPTPA